MARKLGGQEARKQFSGERHNTTKLINFKLSALLAP
jgi:hypothetical protein